MKTRYEEACYNSIDVGKLKEKTDREIMSELFFISQQMVGVRIKCNMIVYTDGHCFVRVDPGLVPTGNPGDSFERNEGTREDWNNLFFEEGIYPMFQDRSVGNVVVITTEPEISDFLLEAIKIKDIEENPFDLFPNVECVFDGDYGRQFIAILTHSDEPPLRLTNTIKNKYKEHRTALEG